MSRTAFLGWFVSDEVKGGLPGVSFCLVEHKQPVGASSSMNTPMRMIIFEVILD
jgi:hypothetical protein